MDKIWWKRFVFALLGLGLYLLDTGSDSWVGHRLIQNCHVRFGAAVFCLVYVLPGLFGVFTMAREMDDVNTFMRFVYGILLVIFFVPITTSFLILNLIKLDDDALEIAKL